MADEKKEQEGKTTEEVKKAEPTITEDELVKTIKDLEDIIKARHKPEPEEEEEEEDEEMEESVTGNFEEDETIAKAIEVSDFLAALVDQSEASHEVVAEKVSSLSKSMTKFDERYIGALGEIQKSIKTLTDSITEKFGKVEERLTKIEATPVTAAKSVVKSGTVLEKSFATGDGKGAEGVDAMPKRKVMELLEKAVAEGKVRDSTLFSYEGSPNFQLPADVKEILKSMAG
jgi:hypothetical protein